MATDTTQLQAWALRYRPSAESAQLPQPPSQRQRLAAQLEHIQAALNQTRVEPNFFTRQALMSLSNRLNLELAAADEELRKSEQVVIDAEFSEVPTGHPFRES